MWNFFNKFIAVVCICTEQWNCICSISILNSKTAAIATRKQQFAIEIVLRQNHTLTNGCELIL